MKKEDGKKAEPKQEPKHEQTTNPSEVTQAPQPVAASSSQKDFLAAAMLSLFLGWFGIDRFYLGYIGTGILKLITFGGCGLWYLIDLILILTGALKSADKQELKGKDKNQKVALIITAVVFAMSFFMSMVSTIINNSNSGLSNSTNVNKPSEDEEVAATKSIPKYEVVKTKEHVGVAKLDEYYVLIGAQDLSNEAFKENIKNMVSDIAKAKDTKEFTVYFFTDEEVLRYYFGEIDGLTPEQIKAMAAKAETTLIASYTGGFDYMTAKASKDDNAYKILWFGSSNRQNPTVGKYVGDEQWKP